MKYRERKRDEAQDFGMKLVYKVYRERECDGMGKRRSGGCFKRVKWGVVPRQGGHVRQV